MNTEPMNEGIVHSLRSRGSVLVMALACTGMLGACGSSKSNSNGSTQANLNTARVARSIEQSILTQRHLRSKVVCPTSVPQEKGRKFECIATTETVKRPVKVGKTPFVVTVQSANGYVTYEGK